jgi:hypothetical protein
MTPPDLNREVGEIKAQVRHLTQDVHEIKTDVKALLAFKWRLMGFASFAAFLSTMIVELIRR